MYIDTDFDCILLGRYNYYYCHTFMLNCVEFKMEIEWLT